MLSPAQISNTIEIQERCDAAKVLGLCWNPIEDVLTFSAQFETDIKYTKRTLLSEASRVFDPLGLVAPCIVPIKTLFQHLWKTKLDWDEELPKELKDQWVNIREDISDLSSITIARWLSITSNMEFEIHGFCDASETAYGAVFYSRQISEFKECTVSLITSKSKVAPVKYLTIPKLELSAAVLLAKMWTVLKEDLKYVKIRSVTVWTDSSIVLDWLSSTNKITDVFVRNRVAAVLDVLSREHWNHIKSENNPADILSRGSTVGQLVNCNLWWKGPSCLNDPNKTWPTIISVAQDAYTGTVSTKREADWLTNVCTRVSSFFKIVMIIARVQQWFKNAKIPRELRSFKISGQDLSFAELVLIQRLQEDHFHDEIAQLKTDTVIKRNSMVKNLNPFLDVHHVMRVGGHISNSIVNFNTSHPIILPHEASVVKKLVEEYHIQYRHAGPTLLSNILKQKYYIVGGRKLTRYVAQKCIQCCRARPTLQMQLMAELPAARVQFQKPFAQVGVDYAGPFSAYHVRRRGQRSVKVYVCLFVCLATKSVHIELASDMTTEAFLGAWKRMTSRRGCCSDIYSDCGSNFIGASRQLKEWYTMLKENSNLIASFLLRQKVTWHFNPPSAPHFGGLWEAAVKSFKTHLRRVIGTNVPTVEEFHTLIVEIEGILNSRPLCRGEGDVDVLTPAHFLIGQPITNLPEHHIPTKTINNNDRWKMVQQMTQHFWSRWHREYLVTLQHRYKWQNKDRNVEVNDIVIIKNENTSSTRWPLGRVICTHPGADGMVRTVTLSTQGGNIKRPIHKLSILLSSESNDSREAGC